MARTDLRKILTAPARGLKALTAAILPSNTGILPRLLLSRSRFAYRVGDGGENSIVVATLGWLERNVTQAPVRIRIPGDDGVTLTPIVRGSQGAGRLLELLDDPNEAYDGGVLLKATVLSYKLDGNAYWQIIRNNQGAPIAIWWMPHTLVEPKRREGSDEFITHYDYTPGNSGTVELLPEDVVHFRDGIDPTNPLKGRSRIRSVLHEVYTDEEAAAYTATILGNMGAPGIVVSPETGDTAMGGVSDTELEDTKEAFEDATTGRNRGRTIVMRGATRLQTFGFSPQQMSVTDLRRVPEERISAVSGVPAIVAGLGAGLQRSTFSNMSEAREAATEEALIPLWGDFSRVIRRRLLPEFEGARLARMVVDFDLSEVRVLKEDQDKTANRYQGLVAAGIAKVSEAREQVGLAVSDEHDIYLRPLSMIEVPGGMTSADMMPEPEPAKSLKAGRVLSGRNASAIAAALDQLRTVLDAAGIDLDASPATSGDGKGRWYWLPGAPVAGDQKRRLSRRAQQQVVVALERDARQLEQRFAQRLAQRFDALGEHVAEAWRAEANLAEGKALEPFDQNLVLRTLRRAAIREWQQRNMDPAYVAHYEGVLGQSSDTLAATVGIEIGERDDVASRILREGGTRAGLVDLEQQTRDAMLSAIADARDEGLGPVDIERRIRQYVTNGGPSASVDARAMRIARTETMHAQRGSTRALYEESGAFTTVVAWDDRLGYGDADCVARNGQEFTFADAEAEEEEEHPNGTLSWAPGTVRE